jgi:outer membrane receptor protein involved in Fe transport
LNGRPSAFGSEVKLDSYTTVDLGAGYRFSPSVTVSGRVQNLFDEEYALAATGAGDLYLAQDRFFSVELRYDYDRQ